MVCSNRRDELALKTTCIKTVNVKIIQKRTGCQYRILLLKRKPKLGRIKLSNGPHAASGPRFGHGWFNPIDEFDVRIFQGQRFLIRLVRAGPSRFGAQCKSWARCPT